MNVSCNKWCFNLTWLILVLNFDNKNSMSNGVVLIKLGVIRWTESLHFLETLFSSVKCWVPCLTESIFN